MACNKNATKPERSKPRAQDRIKNRTVLRELVAEFLFPKGHVLADWTMHGNIKWKPEQLVSQAILFGWQENKHLNDCFEFAHKTCHDIGLKQVANSYTSMMNALTGYGEQLRVPVRQRLQELAQSVAGKYFRVGKFVPIAFDGSRVTTPRTVSNEEAFSAPHHGQGMTAKYRKKQTKGMRRTQNEKNRPHQPKPQTWLTMMWHMALKLPWNWKIGPSHSSERAHVQQMIREEECPENTLFCGDAGFIGYPLWSEIISSGGDFLVRVGANVSLLSENVDYLKESGGQVLCWPKGQMNSGRPPLRLRLVKTMLGKAKVWLLTSVLSSTEMPVKEMIRLYKMRWGIEITQAQCVSRTSLYQLAA
ncbi:MAG: transposase [Planctomycetota bacterium]